MTERTGKDHDLMKHHFGWLSFREDWPGWLPIFIAIVLTALLYPALPEQMVIHWNIQGEPDGWASRPYAVGVGLLMPAGIYALMWFFPLIDPRRENYNYFHGPYRLVRTSLVWMLLAVYGAVIMNSLGSTVAIDRFMPVAIGLPLIIFGNIMGRVRHNYFFGIRTPWTLADEEVWRRTHRFSSPVFVAAGLVTVLGGFFGGIAAFTLAIGSILAAVALTAVYSYRIYRKLHG